MSSDDDFSRWIANSEESDPSVYPELYNISAAFMFKFLPRPEKAAKPEFLYVPESRRALETISVFAEWNMAWESAQLRNIEMFRRDKKLAKRLIPALSGIENRNVYLLPDSPKRLEAYTALYSLLPIGTLERFGLPPLRRMLWPSFGASFRDKAEEILPRDFRVRLSKAFATHVWGRLDSGSKISAFSKDDSLHLLAHNLDFWLPHATRVIENTMSKMDFIEFENDKDIKMLERIRSKIGPGDGYNVERCRMGGLVRAGEEDALQATNDMVQFADEEGKLRCLVDAIRSNRVEEDFSNRWSFAREDFERKLYSKRSRVRVKFVEIDKAASVVSDNSEIHDFELWNDFFAILDKKERQIVVCIANGKTSLADAAKAFGYSNHSAISKILKRIRERARKVMEI